MSVRRGPCTRTSCARASWSSAASASAPREPAELDRDLARDRRAGDREPGEHAMSGEDRAHSARDQIALSRRGGVPVISRWRTSSARNSGWPPLSAIACATSTSPRSASRRSSCSASIGASPPSAIVRVSAASGGAGSPLRLVAIRSNASCGLAVLRRSSEQRLEQPAAVVVGPLQVVDREDDRAARARSRRASSRSAP